MLRPWEWIAFSLACMLCGWVGASVAYRIAGADAKRRAGMLVREARKRYPDAFDENEFW